METEALRSLLPLIALIGFVGYFVVDAIADRIRFPRSR